MSHDLVVTGGTVVSPDQGRYRADVGADDGMISAIEAPGTLDGETVVDATSKHVFPGVFDPHTHHGISRSLAADTESETQSDLVGGVTTTANFFRRPGSYLAIMDEYLDAVEEAAHHDVVFSLGLLSFEHVEEIPAIVEDLGITSFKWYMVYKHRAREVFGVDCDMRDDFADAMLEQLAALDAETTLGFHSENVEITRPRGESREASGADGYEALVEAFPGYAEAQSLAGAATLACHHGYDGSFYAVHISSARTVETVRDLHGAGYGLTGETCPHYLTLTTEECDDLMKINPPIRGQADQDALWAALADGTIDCVGADHCVKPMPGKLGDTVWESENAFPGSALILPLLLSEGYHEDWLSLERVAAVTSQNNAQAWNLYPKKGTIRVGADADLAVVDLDETKTVTPELLQGAADYCVYDGREVTGWPTHTVARGRLAFAEGDVLADPGDGENVRFPVSVD